MNKSGIRAIVRKISRSLANCELCHLARGPINPALAQKQHDGYVRALQAHGVEVFQLPEEPELPDAAFVEDTAIILDEIAIICRPARRSRCPEIGSIAKFVETIRKNYAIQEPGTLEGGDVLSIGKYLFVGLSTRTNRDGVVQLEQTVRPFGYRVIPVAIKDCLHLKTGVTAVNEETLLANPEWIEISAFRGFKVIPVPEQEPWGANTLSVGAKTLVAAAAPQTIETLANKGCDVQAVDISEIQKAEAGLTCLSVLFGKTVRSVSSGRS
jgi:dimethylargininase